MANKDSKLHGVQDDLVPLTAPEMDTYRVRGDDFPFTFKTPEDSSGGSQGAGLEQQDKLCPEKELQVYPRYNADDGAGESGAGTPSVWGKEGKGFTVEKNKGEGDEPAKAMTIAEGVDLVTGKLTCAGYKETVVDETPEASVSIGRH
jgi:hypothetical protein